MTRFDLVLVSVVSLFVGGAAYHYGPAAEQARHYTQALARVGAEYRAERLSVLTGEEPVFTTDWVKDNIDKRGPVLAHLRDNPEARGLEIGSFEGRSAIWFAQNILTHPDARLTCIDPFEFQDGRIEAFFDHNIKAAGIEAKIIKIKGYSGEVLRTLPVNSFDFVYVDGCHLKTCALEDLVLSWPLLKQEGIVIVDDYEFRGDIPREYPRPGINAFIDIYDHAIEILEMGRQVVFRKVGSGY